jgi:hypothetical protein
VTSSTRRLATARVSVAAGKKFSTGPVGIPVDSRGASLSAARLWSADVSRDLSHPKAAKAAIPVVASTCVFSREVAPDATRAASYGGTHGLPPTVPPVANLVPSCACLPLISKYRGSSHSGITVSML